MYKIVKLSKFRTIFGEKLTNTEMYKFISQYYLEFDLITDDMLKQTQLFKYLVNERKSRLSEFGYDFGIFNLPWGNFRLDYPNSPKKDVFGSRFCGPSSESFALKEIRNIISLYKSMRDFGWRKRYLPLTVVRLINHDESDQYVILGGNHRSIIGCFLGYNLALVTNHSECFKEISYKEVCNWYHVKNNHIPKTVALEVFKSFFK